MTRRSEGPWGVACQIISKRVQIDPQKEHGKRGKGWGKKEEGGRELENGGKQRKKHKGMRWCYSG